jgi:hypothetical protein
MVTGDVTGDALSGISPVKRREIKVVLAAIYRAYAMP